MAQAGKTQELISKETDVAVQSAFHALEQAVLIHNAWTLEDLVPLKDMVSEMIRPMLKAWLDDKLPDVVERLVRTEIERRRVTDTRLIAGPSDRASTSLNAPRLNSDSARAILAGTDLGDHLENWVRSVPRPSA